MKNSYIDNIIVSGATGFVGQNLIPFLSNKGLKVIPLSRKRNKDTDLTYESLQMDDWNKASAFIHLAGKAHDTKNVTSASEYFEVNRDVTINLFDQFLASDCKTFIFLSSVKAAADQVNGSLTEGVVPKPQTPYGKSKQEAEQYLLSKIENTDKAIIILRPCMIHGAGNKGNLNLLYKFAQKGVPYPLGAYHNRRSFLSIDSLNIVIEQIIKNQPSSGIYNLADDKAISTVELMRLMGQVMDKKTVILSPPQWFINIIAKIGSGFKLQFNTETLQKLTESYIVDNNKIKKELGITDTWDTIAGLKKTIQSFETIS